MKKRIHLLEIVNGLAIGGAEKKLLELVERLDKSRYRVWVCSIGQGGPLENDFRDLGVEVVILPKRGRFDITLVMRLVRLIKRNRIDLIQTTLWLADVVGAIAAVLAGGIPVISWETVTHGENDVLRTRKRHVLFYRAVMKFVARIVAVSEEIGQSLIRRRGIPPSKIETIQYGVDLKRFADPGGDLSERKRMGLRRGDRLVGTVARLEPYKGVAFMVKAAIRLAHQHSHVYFLFVGDGSLRNELEIEVNRQNLSSRILFLGFRGDVHVLMRLFDLFVLPSLTEGLPNAVLEAMATAKPVVATRVGGVPEAVIHGETGLLVSPSDDLALEEAILRLISDPVLLRRMGDAGRKRVENQFSIERQVERFERLFATVIRERSGK